MSGTLIDRVSRRYNLITSDAPGYEGRQFAEVPAGPDWRFWIYIELNHPPDCSPQTILPDNCYRDGDDIIFPDGSRVNLYSLL